MAFEKFVKCIKPSSLQKYVTNTHLWLKDHKPGAIMYKRNIQTAAKVMPKSTFMAKSPNTEDCSSNQAVFWE